MTMQTNPIPRSLERLQGGHEDSDIVGSVEGRVELGGQEHFYWEPHTALVIPGERKELVVHYTTQVPNFVKTTQVPTPAKTTSATVELCRSLAMCSNKFAWCLACPSTRSPFAANALVADSVAKRGYSWARRQTLITFGSQVLSRPDGGNCCSDLEETCPFCFDQGS